MTNTPTAQDATTPDDVKSFADWIDELKTQVVQDEYGYEEGEFTVYPEHWRSMYNLGITPSAAFKRALNAMERV